MGAGGPAVRGSIALCIGLGACTAASVKDSAPFAEDSLTVVTFNTGTSEGIVGGETGADGYGPEQAALSDTWYGDGLAWLPAVEATRAFLAEVEPDVIGFQEIFWTGECTSIPEQAHAGFVCSDPTFIETTVAQAVLDEGYQVACHPGKPDKCVGVHPRMGRVQGCEDALCLDGLDGYPIEGCGSGARVARARIVDPSDASRVRLTVVHVHGSSGLTPDDQACRTAQVAQVTTDLGDGAPALDPSGPTIVLGDLNTDPGRFTAADTSAEAWAQATAADNPLGLRFVSDVGADAPRSYQGLADIDHVMATHHTGRCDATLLQPDAPHPVYAPAYFDHRPVVCTLEPQ